MCLSLWAEELQRAALLEHHLPAEVAPGPARLPEEEEQAGLQGKYSAERQAEWSRLQLQLQRSY